MINFINSCDGIYSDSLDVRFTKQCDNNCPFCIEKTGIQAQPQNLDLMIESTIKSGKKTVLILGGEPFLLINELREYIIAIRQHVENIYITTSLPNTITKHYDIFEDIMLLIDGLNVSLQHWDWEQNNKILHTSDPHNRIKLLETICKNPAYADKARISINIVKGSIDSKAKLDDFLDAMESIGVKHVKINELQHTPDLYVSFEEIYDMKLPSPYAHGCQYDIKLVGHNIRITLKRACFCVEQSKTANLADFIKVIAKKTIHKCKAHQVVLYESGQLSNGWQSSQKGKL